jgi:hypothetical protein
MNKFDYALYIRRQQLREHKNRALIEQRKRMKKQQRKENIILGVVSIIVIGICIIGISKLHKNDMNNCINAGHTKEYCESGF